MVVVSPSVLTSEIIRSSASYSYSSAKFVSPVVTCLIMLLTLSYSYKVSIVSPIVLTRLPTMPKNCSFSILLHLNLHVKYLLYSIHHFHSDMVMSFLRQIILFRERLLYRFSDSLLLLIIYVIIISKMHYHVLTYKFAPNKCS